MRFQPSVASVPPPAPPGSAAWSGSAARAPLARPPAAIWTATLLDLVDPGPESSVVLIGPGALDLGCTLMKTGTAEVAFVRLGECPHNIRADIALVPQPGCLDAATRAVTLATRMLSPLGTLALGGLAAEWIAPLEAQLRARGFDAVHAWAGADGMLLRAELPLHGRLSCA